MDRVPGQGRADRGLISPRVAVSAVYVGVMFMAILDATIVNVALPALARDFGVPATSERSR